jgi:RNA polymerase sigma factor (sigma-70 family)
MEPNLSTNTPDADLVLAAQNGDISAFEPLYRRYFGPVYDLAARTMKDRDAAADVTQDSFIKAQQRIGQLRDPGAFRPWLYAIVRNETISSFRTRSHETSVPTLDGEDWSGGNPLLSEVADDVHDDPVAAAELSDSAALVWEAAASLDTDTYTVLDLHVRQGLSSAEIADVLGISKGNAYTKLNRMKERTGAAISTYLLVRKGAGACEVLSRIVAPMDLPPVTQSQRRAVDRHVTTCDACDERRRALAAPMQIFAALAAVPPPQELEAAIWETVSGSPSGSIRPPRRRTRYAMMLVAVLIALVGLASGVAVGLNARDEQPVPSSPVEFLAGSDAETSNGEQVPPVTTASATPPPVTPPPATTPPATSPPATTPPATTPPATTPPATSPPDTTPPSIAQPAVIPGEIWELDGFVSCPANTPRIAEITALVTDKESDIDAVSASWTIGGSSSSALMVLSNGAYRADFGPFTYPTVTDLDPYYESIGVIITATDLAGNETKTTVNLVVNSLASCFF